LEIVEGKAIYQVPMAQIGWRWPELEKTTKCCKFQKRRPSVVEKVKAKTIMPRGSAGKC
jgi:hypothetical protein